MPGILPIIVAAGALALVASKKKNKRRRAPAEDEGGEGGVEPSGAPGSGMPDWPDEDEEDEGTHPSPHYGGFHITARPSKKKKTYQLGEVCGPISERRAGVWSAFDSNGKCVVFWNRESDAVMVLYIREELNKLGASTKKACLNDVWESDPFSASGGGRWVPNPTKRKVLMRAIKRAYPQIPTEHMVKGKTVKLLPPDERAPYYVHMVWKFSEAAYMREVCGYIPVT